METWTYLSEFPKELLNVELKEIDRVLKKPSLIFIKGTKNETIFLSTLLHGNETSGFYSIQSILKRKTQLQKNLLVLLGNPLAAAQSQRQLAHQPDFNRIWDQAVTIDLPLQRMAQEILTEVRKHPLIAAIDIHNTTGHNPFYVATSLTSPKIMNLGSLFSDIFVRFLTPRGTLSQALENDCPSFTIECGRSDNPSSVPRVVEFLDSLLQLDHISELPKHRLHPTIYESFAKIILPKNSRYQLHPEFDQWNFSVVKKSSIFIESYHGDTPFLLSTSGQNIFEDFFSIENNQWVAKKDFVPSLLSKDPVIVESDCLGYIMNELV